VLAQPGEIRDMRFAHLPDTAAAAWYHAERVIKMFQFFLTIPLIADHYTIRQN